MLFLYMIAMWVKGLFAGASVKFAACVTVKQVTACVSVSAAAA